MFKINSIILILSFVIFGAQSQLYTSARAGISFIDDNRLQQNNNNLNNQRIDYAKNVKLNRRIYAMCPPNFINVGNDCYSLIEQESSWLEAHFFCKDKNSKLAEPQKNSDPRLRKFLQNYDRNKIDPIWIGATYDWQNNVWQWSISGKNLSYNNFVPTQDDKIALGNHCAVFDPQLNYGWSARSCPDKHRFICQHKMPRVSEKNRFRVYERWNSTFPNQLANEYVLNVRNGTRLDRRARPTQNTQVSRSTEGPNGNDIGLLRLHPNDINTESVNVESTTALPPTMNSRKGGRRSRKRTDVDRKLQKQRERERRRLQRKRERQQKLRQERQQRRRAEEERRRAEEDQRRAEEHRRAEEERRREEENRYAEEERHHQPSDEAAKENHEIAPANLEKQREQEDKKRQYDEEVEERQRQEQIRRVEETKAKQAELERLNEQNRLKQKQLEEQRAEELKRQQEEEEKQLELQRHHDAKRLEQQEQERLKEENRRREQNQRKREEEIAQRKLQQQAIEQEEERTQQEWEQEEKQRQQQYKEEIEREERAQRERAEAEKQQQLAEEKAKNERLAVIAKEEAERVRRIKEKKRADYAQRIANLAPADQKAFFEVRRRRKQERDKQRQKHGKKLNDVNEAYLNTSTD